MAGLKDWFEAGHQHMDDDCCIYYSDVVMLEPWCLDSTPDHDHDSCKAFIPRGYYFDEAVLDLAAMTLQFVEYDDDNPDTHELVVKCNHVVNVQLVRDRNG